MTGDVTLGNLSRMLSNNAFTIKGITAGTSGFNGVVGGTTPAAGTFTNAKASNVSFSGNLIGAIAQYSTAAISGTFGAGQLTGAPITVLNSTTSTPGTVTTRTAVQMFADQPAAAVGMSYLLSVYHTGSGTLTLGAGSDVTLTGTATISTSTWRAYVVTFNSATAITFQNIGSGAV